MDHGTPELDALYRDVILDHYRTPRGRDPLPDADIANDGMNPVCGDELTVALKLGGGKVEKVHVHGRGCSISVASSSMMADLLAGKSREEVARIAEAFKKMMHGEPLPQGLDMGDLDSLQGVRQFPVRVKCAMLAWTTLADALKAYDAGERKPAAASTTETGGEQA